MFLCCVEHVEPSIERIDFRSPETGLTIAVVRIQGLGSQSPGTEVVGHETGDSAPGSRAACTVGIIPSPVEENVGIGDCQATGLPGGKY